MSKLKNMEKTERQLRGEWLDRLSETINFIPWEASAETWQFTYVGPQAVKILGYPIHQWYEKGFWTDHIHPEDREFTIDFCLNSSQTVQDYEFEYRMMAADGSVVWLSDIVTVESVDGIPKTLRGFMIDITKRRMTEQDLLRSERRFREISFATSDLIYSWNPESGDLNWHGDIDASLGYERGEFPRTIEAIMANLHPDDYNTVKTALAKHREDGKPFALEYRIKCKDGTYRHWLDRATTIRDQTGEVYESVGACSDITELKNAQEQLRQQSAELSKSEDFLRMIIETAPNGMVLVKETGAITLVNHQTQELFGYDRDELLGQPLEMLLPGRFRRKHSQHLMAYFNQPRVRPMGGSMELFGLRKDGSEFPIDVSLSFFESEEEILACASIRDVTQRKQTEAELQKSAQELQALSGRLLQVQEEERQRIARELHDQLGQDLALLSIEIEQLCQKVSQPQAKSLHELAMKTKELTSQVQTLSHRLHPSQLTHLGLVTASRSLCNDVSRASGIRIDFSDSGILDSIPKELSVCLYRVLQESLGNVVKHSGTREVQVELAGGPGEIQLQICDSGIGFDPDLPKETFGLGLVSMRERLHFAGGSLLVESQPSAGTRIKACVPLPVANCPG